MSLQGRPLKVRYAYQQVADEIEGQIVTGTLRPGDPLPGEVELAEMFGVTRSTVREGLRRLESEGLVRRPSPRRLEVAPPRPERLASRAGRTMMLMEVTFRELWQVAREVEPLAAALAVEHATEPEIDALEAVQHEIEAALHDIHRTTDADTRFHSMIAAMGKNRVVALSREPVVLLLYHGFGQIADKVPQCYDRQVAAHRQILAALRDRDPDAARLAARRHIEDFWRGVKLAGLSDETPVVNPGTLF